MSADTCVICHEPHSLATYNEAFANCACAHTYFHRDCIAALLRTRGPCPTCRSAQRPVPEVTMRVRDIVIFAFAGFYALCMLCLIAGATVADSTDEASLSTIAVWSNTPKYLYLLVEAVFSIRRMESGFVTRRMPGCASFLVAAFALGAILATYVTMLTDDLSGTMQIAGAIIGFEYLVFIAVLGIALALTITGLLARACRCI